MGVEDGLSEAMCHFDGDLRVAAHRAGRAQSERKDDEAVLHVVRDNDHKQGR